MIRTWMTANALLALLVGGCGAQGISQELADARRVMETARASDAAELEPDMLHVAQRTLDRAEAAEDGSPVEADLAYVADRQARLAMANANTERAMQQMERAQTEYREELERVALDRGRTVEEQGEILEAFRERLLAVRAELDERGEDLDQRTEELREREEELASRVNELMAERAARAAAEERAEAAMRELQRYAPVRQEADRTIVTLTGEVLFESGRAELRGTAARRLDAVVAVAESRPGTIRIEGHTDSRGSSLANHRLSLARARAVRDYLVNRGIAAQRIDVIGRGEDMPLTTNDTPEGRANNRRVEISFENAPQPLQQQPVRRQLQQQQRRR